MNELEITYAKRLLAELHNISANLFRIVEHLQAMRNQREGTDEQKGSGGETKYGPERVSIADAEGSENSTEKDSSQSNNSENLTPPPPPSRWHKFKEWAPGNITEIVMVFLTFGIVYATFSYAHYAKLQWKTMDRQLTDYEDAMSARLSIENFSVGGEDKTQLSIIIANRGNSMALNIVSGGRGGPVENGPVNLDEINRSMDEMDKEMIYPPPTNGQSLQAGGTTSDGMRIEKGRYWWWGVEFAYMDIFGHEHTVTGCWYSTRRGVFHCPWRPKRYAGVDRD
jgi:hypothetical protein